MIYAVGLMAMAELTRTATGLPLLILLKGIVEETPIQTMRGMQHQALPVRDGVSRERWQAIVKLIRSRYRYPEFPLYEKTKGYWRAVR